MGNTHEPIYNKVHRLSDEIKVDEEGILQIWIRQPVDNTPYEDENGITYTEKFKGSYEKGKSALDSIWCGLAIDEVHDYLNSSSYGGQYNECITSPEPPIRDGWNGTWKVKDVRVDENTDAGAHCTLTITYYADYTNFVGGWMEDEKSNVWNIDWQSYTVSPYNFLANLNHEDAIVYDERNPPEIDWEQYGMRSHIENYIAFVSTNKTASFCYKTADQFIPSKWFMMLNGAEQAVYKKAAIDRNAVYHYPVVTHNTAMIAPLSCLSGDMKYPDYLGGDLDTISADNPQTQISCCPFLFDKYQGKEWVFMKVGDNVQTTKDIKSGKVRVERKEQWIGSTEFDINYYGDRTFTHDEGGIMSCRWLINGL